MREPKFKPGDRVRHLGSGQYAVILGLRRTCQVHMWTPRSNYFAECVESDKHEDCAFDFSGAYLVQTGIGERSQWASEVSLVAAGELPA